MPIAAPRVRIPFLAASRWSLAARATDGDPAHVPPAERARLPAVLQ